MLDCVECVEIECGRIHGACTLDEIVSLIDEQADTPLVGDGPAEEHCASVEVVVEVADYDVAPAGQFLAQVVRANLVAKRDLTDGFLVEECDCHCLGACRWQAIVEPACQRAYGTV